MRGVVSSLPRRIVALVLLAAMIVCSVAGISQHLLKSSNESGALCSSSCASHGQHVAINNHAKSEDDNEKEPAPPLTSWNNANFRLELLYLAPIGVAYWILTQRKQILLSTQMRF